MKTFELKNGVIQEASPDSARYIAKISDGGYATDAGGFWASITAIDGYRCISGKIKSPDIYYKILQAYLNNEQVAITEIDMPYEPGI